MLVYFHIDELARDAVVASALKKELERVGGRIVYGNRLTTDYLLRHFNIFDAIILPSLIHFVGAFPNPENLPKNVFILQTEAIGQATGTLRRLNGKYFGDNSEKCEPWHRSVAGFLLWGHSHLNPFITFYPSYLPKCRVVGHPRLSKSCNKTENSGKKIKPVVGFVSRFNGLNPFDSRTPFETICNGMKYGKTIFPLYENSPDKDVEDMLYIESIDFRIMIQVMMSLDPKRYTLTVRPHPRENRQGWENLAEKLNIDVDMSPWDEPFGHWLQRIDFIVTPPSTSLYDVFYHGKIPIVTDSIVPSRSKHVLTESDDNNQILEGTYRPKSVDEVIAAIESGRILFNKEIVDRRLLEQVGSDVAEKSTTNIINAIAEWRANCNHPQKRMRKKIMSHVFKAVSLTLAYARGYKGRFKGRVEQSCGFDLTVHRMRWIDRLTSAQ